MTRPQSIIGPTTSVKCSRVDWGGDSLLSPRPGMRERESTIQLSRGKLVTRYMGLAFVAVINNQHIIILLTHKLLVLDSEISSKLLVWQVYLPSRFHSLQNDHVPTV